jgi:hypothetical protein
VQFPDRTHSGTPSIRKRTQGLRKNAPVTLLRAPGDVPGNPLAPAGNATTESSVKFNRALATIVPYDATRLRKRCRPNAWVGAFEFRLPSGWSLIPSSPL